MKPHLTSLMVPFLHSRLNEMSAACAGVIDHASRASSPAVIVFNIVGMHVFWACSSVRFVQHRKASFRCLVACCLVRDLLLVAKHLFPAARTSWACGHPGAGRCMRRATALRPAAQQSVMTTLAAGTLPWSDGGSLLKHRANTQVLL